MRIKFLHFYIRRNVLLFFTCLIFFNSFSQSKKFENTVINPYLNSNKYLTEYFYTQLNKSSYFPSENVWFQIFVLDKKNQKLFNLTKKIYVDFFNDSGKLIESKILKVDEGVTSSVFKIPSTYTSETLFLKVYTEWSKNFNNSFLTPIQINIKPAKTIRQIQDSIPKIYFFPESGSFIENVPTRVGVKVLDKYNKGFSFKGGITDNLGNFIVSFSTNSLGMGSFVIKPQKNKKYRIEQFFNEEHIYLPSIKKEGVLFNVYKKNNELRFFFRTNISFSNNDSYYYLIHNNNKIAVAGYYKFNGESTVVVSHKNKKLLRGLNIITLFDKSFNPIGERVIFNYDGIFKKEAKITISNKRVNDTVGFSIYKQNLDSIYKLAISILPIESVSKTSSSTFLSDYFLSSEIKGYIEDPTFYFKDEDNLKEIDYLLLTQGWRKYDWNKIKSNDTIQVKHFFESGFNIIGEVKYKKNKPLPFEKVSFMTEHEAGEVITDSLGNFSIPSLQLVTKEKIKIFSKEKKKKKFISASQLFTKEDSVISVPRVSYFNHIKLEKKASIFGNNFESLLNIYKEREILNEVVLLVDKKENLENSDDDFVHPMDRTSFTKSFYINDENVNDFASVLSYLRTQPGIRVSHKSDNVLIYSKRAMSQKIERDPRPLDVYINNRQMEQYEIDELNYLDMTQVKSVKVNLSGVGYGSRSPFGVVSIYTRGKPIFKKNSGNKSTSSTVIVAKQGYEIKKEYYTPDYIYPPTSNYYKKYATIHWQPMITLSDQSFYFKAKVPKEIKQCVVLIEGVSEKGHIISMFKEMFINESK